jgi:hypothetical protein
MTSELRTAAHTQEVIQQARMMNSNAQRKKLLSDHGLRNVDVSDPQLQYDPCPGDILELECILAY